MLAEHEMFEKYDGGEACKLQNIVETISLGTLATMLVSIARPYTFLTVIAHKPFMRYRYILMKITSICAYVEESLSQHFARTKKDRDFSGFQFRQDKDLLICIH